MCQLLNLDFDKWHFDSDEWISKWNIRCSAHQPPGFKIFPVDEWLHEHVSTTRTVWLMRTMHSLAGAEGLQHDTPSNCKNAFDRNPYKENIEINAWAASLHQSLLNKLNQNSFGGFPLLPLRSILISKFNIFPEVIQGCFQNFRSSHWPYSQPRARFLPLG